MEKLYSHITTLDPTNIGSTSLLRDSLWEMRNYQRNSGSEMPATSHLAYLLDKSTKAEHSPASYDPLKTLLHHSMSKEFRKPENENKILLQTNLAAKDLRNFKELKREQQETLEAFCKNLYKEFSAYTAFHNTLTTYLREIESLL